MTTSSNDTFTNLSVIIPSLKPKQHVQIPPFLDQYEIIISQVQGRSQARNDGANKAHGSVLLFMDDDVTFSESTFKAMRDVLKEGIIVCRDATLLGTRAMLIMKRDFWRVGGFDGTFHVGEDMDFGFRALQHDMTLMYFSDTFFYHKTHASRSIWRVWIERLINRLRFMVRYRVCRTHKEFHPLTFNGFIRMLICFDVSDIRRRAK